MAAQGELVLMSSVLPGIPLLALVRRPGARFAECITTVKLPIDLQRARKQHEAYCQALESLGVEVVALDPIDELPDACFVEDVAVVLGEHAMLTRPGVAARRAEVAHTAPTLAGFRSLHAMDAPATLEGGDVLRLGDRLLVGCSKRTNIKGIHRLAEIAHLEGLETYPLQIPGHMHLKCLCTALDANTIILDLAAATGTEASMETLATLGIEAVGALEPIGGNVLRIGPAVLVSAECPRTAAMLERRGLDVIRVPGSEFHKGDGRLTCLSLRIPRPGEWVC
jgi:dimethylargininase